MQILLAGSADIDEVIAGFDMIDVRPEQEVTVGQVRDCNTGMVERKELF